MEAPTLLGGLLNKHQMGKFPFKQDNHDVFLSQNRFLGWKPQYLTDLIRGQMYPRTPFVRKQILCREFLETNGLTFAWRTNLFQ